MMCRNLMVIPPPEASLPHSDTEGVCTIRQFTVAGLLEELQEALELLKQVLIVYPLKALSINFTINLFRLERTRCVWTLATGCSCQLTKKHAPITSSYTSSVTSRNSVAKLRSAYAFDLVSFVLCRG